MIFEGLANELQSEPQHPLTSWSFRVSLAFPRTCRSFKLFDSGQTDFTISEDVPVTDSVGLTMPKHHSIMSSEIAPTSTRLVAHNRSRLNQLRDRNRIPNQRYTPIAIKPPESIMAAV